MAVLLTFSLPDPARGPEVLVQSWNRYWAGMHWAKRRKYMERVAYTVAQAAQEAAGGRVELATPVAVEIALVSRHPGYLMDPDNVCVKPIVDGLVLAGLIPDDDWRHVARVSVSCVLDREEAPRRGRLVRVSISSTEEA